MLPTEQYSGDATEDKTPGPLRCGVTGLMP